MINFKNISTIYTNFHKMNKILIPFHLIYKYQYQYQFSSGKNYASSFKVRARLSQFFKYVHPDQMHQAPTQIKQENLRSLKNLNAYIDSINQQKSIEAKLLKFYIAQKTNHKSKKFFSFSIQLPEVSSTAVSQSSKIQKLMEDIVTSLNKKFQQSKNIGNNKKKKSQKQEQSSKQSLKTQQRKSQTEQQRLERIQQTISPFKKQRQLKKQLMQSQLESTITSKYMQSQKDQLMAQLRKNFSFANTSTNKPMMWSRLAIESSGIYTDYQDILMNLIDPKLIYFDEKLTKDQIQAFKKSILPGSIQRKQFLESKLITKVCQQMESIDPPICFYVTDKYSGNQIPGFFSVPYNFSPKQLQLKFEQLKDQIIEQRQKFEQFYDYHKQLLQELKINNNILIQFDQFKNNNDIWNKILLLKRLSRYIFQNLTRFVPFQQQQFDIFLFEYKLSPGKTVYQYQNQVIILINYIEKDLQDLFVLNQNKQDNSLNKSFTSNFI